MYETAKCMISSYLYMSPNKRWILYIAAIICIALALIGGMMYPLNQLDIISILAYEVVVIFFMLAIIKLIYDRGLPDNTEYEPM